MSDRRASQSSQASQTSPATETRRASDGHPARQTEEARTSRRNDWYGHGERTVTEKDPVGLFLDDVSYVFADISILSVPALSAVMLATPRQWFGVKGAALVAWAAMVGAAALFRSGLVTPLATDAPGWVSMTPWLVVFRLAYYNATLGLAAIAGSAAEAAVSPFASIAVAFVVGALAIGLFPRLAESFYRVVAD